MPAVSTKLNSRCNVQEARSREAKLQHDMKAQDDTRFQLEDTLAYKRNLAKQDSFAEQVQQV